MPQDNSASSRDQWAEKGLYCAEARAWTQQTASEVVIGILVKNGLLMTTSIRLDVLRNCF